MRRWLHDNALSLTLFGLFFACLIAQSIMGWMNRILNAAITSSPRLATPGFLSQRAFCRVGVRELGERVSARCRLCHSDGIPGTTRLGGVQKTPIKMSRRRRPKPGS